MGSVESLSLESNLSSITSFASKTELRDKVLFGETEGNTPLREYECGADMLAHESINRSAVIQYLWVFSGNLAKSTMTPKPGVIGHWWVVFRDSDWNYWTAENVGALVLAKVKTLSDGMSKRKNINESEAIERVQMGLKTLVANDAHESRTMWELIDWLETRKILGYNVLVNNCQDFAKDLCQFLSGISVRTQIPKKIKSAIERNFFPKSRRS
jgi:hypothetical protein